jgi:RimJ/RimL family protein N-acetyltransferase
LLAADPPDYRKHFIAFPVESDAIASMLEVAEQDRFWGIFVKDELAALVMLRGLDAGFEAPAFGVYVGKPWSDRGFAGLALAFAQSWCRLNDRAELMLTVHPENGRARRTYEREGFLFSGEYSPLGHRVYRKHLGR